MRCWLPTLLLCVACATPAPPPAAPPPAPPPPARDFTRPGEPHLQNVRQLTFGGENAEAYWSWAGDALTLQARGPEAACDRIFRLPLTPAGLPAAAMIPVSSGRGATTCSFFLPGDRELIYASTEAGGGACPPRPDHSQGYVWALYPDYDIYRANADGSGARRLTTTPGYDAEGTVCGKDGSIVFTSVRDGDIDVYRMDADGKHVKRLTHDVGYDGGAVFDADCTHIVWRASRPKPGKDLDDYKRLLAQNLVRPSKLELYVMDADGANAHQVTYLDAASFGPAFMPGGKRIIFASNHGDPKGREFDLWAIDVAGTRLERITDAPGFDGFPLFSATASGWRSRRTARRSPASTTRTCSSRTGDPTPSRPRRRRPPPIGSWKTSAGWRTRRARGAASAPPVWRRPAPSSRRASRS